MPAVPVRLSAAVSINEIRSALRRRGDGSPAWLEDDGKPTHSRVDWAAQMAAEVLGRHRTQPIALGYARTFWVASYRSSTGQITVRDRPYHAASVAHGQATRLNRRDAYQRAYVVEVTDDEVIVWAGPINMLHIHPRNDRG